MPRIALQMLFGDRTKYLTLVLGLAFATLLMVQQGAIFLGLLIQSTGALQNVHQPDLWITDPATKWIGDSRSLSDDKLDRIRSVPGVRWAEPFFNNWAVVELPDGNYYKVQLLGIPRQTMIGRPPAMVEGRLEDLRIPDAVIIEHTSRDKLNNVEIGDVLKLNDRRAVVVGFCEARKGFESNAILYTTYDNAIRFTPVGRKRISFILVKAQEGVGLPDLQARIAAVGDVVALTPDQFRFRSIDFILKMTGIGINFGITIVLGFIVGLALSAAIFYQFTVENLRAFATLKALGTGNARLAVMVLIQALAVGVIGYGLGAGLAAVFAIASRKAQSELTVFFPWQLLALSFVASMLCIGLASLLSIRRVVSVSPGVVFGS